MKDKEVMKDALIIAIYKRWTKEDGFKRDLELQIKGPDGCAKNVTKTESHRSYSQVNPESTKLLKARVGI